MDFDKAYKMMDIEIECIRRASTGICNRYCSECDLVQEDSDLIEAYQIAKFCIDKIRKNTEYE